MKFDDLDARMRALETFHSLRVPPGAWLIVRVDGRSFSRFTRERFAKPFDETFHYLMRHTARHLMGELNGLYAFTESDEISLLAPRNWNFFGREVEKIVSVSAGVASAAFTQAAGEIAVFDSRIVVGATDELVVDYFRWRQADATRCALNGYCYWTLRQAGHDERAATAKIEGQSREAKLALLGDGGVDFAAVPTWQRHGTGIYWETVEKSGFNPILNTQEIAVRRHLVSNENLPAGDAYGEFLRRVIAGTLRNSGGSTGLD